MDVDNVPGLAQAASIIGPDFYAILMILVVTATSATMLMRAQKRTPKLSSDEIKPYRQFFLFSWRSAFVIVFLSIGWHMYKQLHNVYVVQITIADLPSNIKIDSRYYNKTSFRHSNLSIQPLTDYNFLIVKDSPFKEGDFFEFQIFVVNLEQGAGGLGNDIRVDFSGNNLYSYRLNINENNQPELQPISLASSNKPVFNSSDILLANASFYGRTK